LIVSTDPKRVSPIQYRQLLREFIEAREFEQLQTLVLKVLGHAEHTSFLVTCSDLIDFDPSLAYVVIHHPKLLLPIFDEAVFEAQTNLFQHPAVEKKHGRKGSVKLHCHVRLVGLPPLEYLTKPTIGDIRAGDVCNLVQISGTVVRTGAVR
jgi:DNA replicative helicase MCM subunit Mcm2 (Cdc46/Mcm family)